MSSSDARAPGPADARSPNPGAACAELAMRLADLPGVSGDEGAVRDAIWAAVEPCADAAHIDALGNLVVRRDAAGAAGAAVPRVLVDAHMDEVGLMVQRVDRDGYLRFAAVGGIDPRVLPGAVVEVGPARVPGVIGWKPVHLQDGDDGRRVVPARDLAIDIGALSREQAEKAAAPGAYAAFATRSAAFGDGLIRGKALDDRVGCAVLASLLDEAYGCEVHAVFTVQEEIGLRGAGVAAHAVAPDLAIALEGTACADVPGVDPHARSTVSGDGPVLTFMDGGLIADPRVNALLEEAAAAAGIPYQWKRGTTGRTDAGRIHLTRGGVPSAVVSVPCRYIHSPCAVAARADIGHALALVRAFLRTLARKGFTAA